MGVGPVVPSATEISVAVAGHASDTTSAHTAAGIDVADTAGNYTATTVEGVLAELPSQFAPLPAVAGAVGQVLAIADADPLTTEWASASAMASTLNGLTDVNAPTPATADVLTWSGTEWVNDPIVLDLSTAPATSPATGDYLTGTDTSAANANAKFLVSDVLALGATGGVPEASDTRSAYAMVNDCMQVQSNAYEAGFQYSALGGTVSDAIGETGRPGIAQLSTSTSATGRSSITSNFSVILFGGGEHTFETDVWLTTISDGTQRYVFRAGFMQSVTALPTDGAWLEYDDSVSANWIMSTASASSRTQTASSTAVAIGSWVRLAVIVNAAGTSVEYFVNGASIGTVTTDIPTASGSDSGVAVTLIKSIGTTARTVRVDRVFARIESTR